MASRKREYKHACVKAVTCILAMQTIRRRQKGNRQRQTHNVSFWA